MLLVRTSIYFSLALLCLILESHAVRILPRDSASSRQQQQQQESQIKSDYNDYNDYNDYLHKNVSARRLLEERRNLKRNVQVEIPDSPDGHLVTDLPLLDKSQFTTPHWAGHLPASPGGTKYFFYWLFAPEMNEDAVLNDNNDVPLLIWLNGGPGCSSMDGLFLENGPFRLQLNETTQQYQLNTDDHYSWHKLPAYTLYIDQPVGTGLSFTTNRQYPSNDAELSTDFYYFLQSFLDFHRDKFVVSSDDNDHNQQQQQILSLNRPLHFSGESYAGHYIGIYVNHILQQNRDAHNNIYIPMAGAAIGNGWVDPYYQYAGAEAAYGHGLIGAAEVAAYQEKERQCQRQLNQQRYHASICFDLIDDLVDESKGYDSQYIISSYDIRRVERKHQPRSFPPGHHVTESYLGGWPLETGSFPEAVSSLQVLEALHATAAGQADQRFRECTDPPYDALKDKDGQGVVPDIVEALEHADKVKFLFFNGIMDLVCNHVGNERALEKMPWQHQKDWNTAKRYAWTAPGEEKGKVSGYMREYQNLMCTCALFVLS